MSDLQDLLEQANQTGIVQKEYELGQGLDMDHEAEFFKASKAASVFGGYSLKYAAKAGMHLENIKQNTLQFKRWCNSSSGISHRQCNRYMQLLREFPELLDLEIIDTEFKLEKKKNSSSFTSNSLCNEDGTLNLLYALNHFTGDMELLLHLKKCSPRALEIIDSRLRNGRELTRGVLKSIGFNGIRDEFGQPLYTVEEERALKLQQRIEAAKERKLLEHVPDANSDFLIENLNCLPLEVELAIKSEELNHDSINNKRDFSIEKSQMPQQAIIEPEVVATRPLSYYVDSLASSCIRSIYAAGEEGIDKTAMMNGVIAILTKSFT
jgi:hypothetical protein